MNINLLSLNKTVHHSQVEWDILSGIISQFAYFERNKEKLLSTIFTHQLEELRQELAITQSYLKLVNDDHRQILKQVLSRIAPDNSVEKLKQHLSKKGVLSFSELNKLTRVIETGIFLKKDFPKLEIQEFKTIHEIEYISIQRNFLKEFRHLVDESGDLHLDRHPELSALNLRLRELEEKIRRVIQDWMIEPQHSKILQFSSYDIHYDRYVVPIRSDSYRSDIGLIVSRSETGQTLFVEPFEVRDYCNKRMEVVAKIDEIINQLAMKFSFTLYEYHHILNETYNQLLRVDFYLAKSDFATEYSLECPRIRTTPGFRLTKLFHPLIKNPIKNNADCSQGDSGIVISGPNTGGKTVFLKSLSLAYLLFYHGFFVPAAEAEMYPYEGLFYFGNDLQNLQSGLSSFSGEVKNYIELLEQISPSNLILIDEIFNSTSSDEASALSLAYFNELHKKAICHIVVSTHHQMFKTFIHQNQRYISCHVGFDTERMKPTYKIQWGTPGASMAIDIFRILSRNHPDLGCIPDEAIKHLNNKNISYETLLQRVSQKQIELDQLLTANRQLEVELKNQKGSMEGILNLKLNEELNKARREVDKIFHEARQIVEEARRQENFKIKKIEEKSHELHSKIRSLNKTEEKEELSPPAPIGDLDIKQLKIGDIVFSQVLKKEFTVLSIDLRKNEVQIGKGPIKLTVPSSTLSSTKKAPLRAKVSVSFEKNSNARFEYDVRGLRLSECQSTIERALGDLLTGDIPFVHIIHGHGDGILKNWLRDYVKKSKDFAIDSSESGNDGETRIIIK